MRNPAFASHHLLSASLDVIGAPMSFARNEEIYREGEKGEYLKVISKRCQP